MRISDWSSDVCSSDLSGRSAGGQISFGEDRTLTVRDLAGYDFAGTDIALFAAGGDVSKGYAPKAGAAGCVVIDNSSAFRMDPDVPLVVPEVNPDALARYGRRHIVANPNCSNAQMVVRSEARRVGNGWISTCSSRWSPYHKKKKK